MTKKDFNFSQKYDQLQEIVKQMEQSETDIDTSIDLFERGAQISKELKQYLKTAKNKVEKIAVDIDATD